MTTTTTKFSSILVIGGEGFLGHNLVLALLKHYPHSSIWSLDLTQRYFNSNPLLPTNQHHSIKHQQSNNLLLHHFIQADLTSSQSLIDAFHRVKPQVVFHTASPWTGSSFEICHQVNVQGTINTINASILNRVTSLVYTSSAGVLFNGNHLINVDERLPIPKVGCDHYNTSKAKAEAIVLEANGKEGLLTCAIRPAGIFGPGDRQAIPGMIQVLKNKQDWIQIGDNKNLFDWTYVDNVVHAHILALERLKEKVPLKAFETSLKPIFKTIKQRNLLSSAGMGGSSSSRHETDNDSNLGGVREESIENLELIDLSDEIHPSGLRAAVGTSGSSSNDSNGNNPTSWINGNEDLIDLPLPAKRHRWDQWAPISTQINYPNQSVPVAGETFLITGGEPIFFWDFARSIWAEYSQASSSSSTCKSTKKLFNLNDQKGVNRKFTLVIPSYLALVLAFLAQLWSKISGKPTLFTPEKVRYTCVSKYHSIEKARVVLGYEPLVGVQEGIQKSVQWYILNESLQQANSGISNKHDKKID